MAAIGRCWPSPAEWALCLIWVELFCQTFSLLACRNNVPENGQEDCVLRGFVMVGRGIGKMRLAGNFGIIL